MARMNSFEIQQALLQMSRGTGYAQLSAHTIALEEAAKLIREWRELLMEIHDAHVGDRDLHDRVTDALGVIV